MYRPFLFFVMFFIPGIVLGNFVKTPMVFVGISVVSLLGFMFIQSKNKADIV